MQRIPVESVEVVTVDETLGKRKPEAFAQSIVRLKPSAVAEQSDVKQVAEELRQHALAVKVLPRPPANRLVMAAQGNLNVTSQMPKDTRGFVLTSVDPANTELLEYLTGLCDAEGL